MEAIEATTATAPKTDRERIVDLVEALTGERHEVTTEKRRGGYWYACCGAYETPKGVQGADGERWAVDGLLARLHDVAERSAGGLQYYGERVARELLAVEGARKKLEAAERGVAEACERVAAAERDLEAQRAKVGDRERAVYDALRGP